MSRSYFCNFLSIAPNPSAPIATEFERLARAEGWAKQSKRYREERERCLRSEFEQHYGRNTADLAGWQALCREVDGGEVEAPLSITACRKVLQKVHVSIVELVDRRRTGSGTVHRFKSGAQLARYLRNHKDKIYPKKMAKADGFLKALLRQVF